MSGASDDTDALIFVDVDGVVNVCARGEGSSNLLLSKGNMELALQEHEPEFLKTWGNLVAKVSTVAQRYGDLACPDEDHFSAILVLRLANIIKAAGGRRTVVLSSKWRRKEARQKVEHLEEALAQHLGDDFEFDGRTEIVDENGARDRLRCIGNYVRRHCKWHPARALRILILDDFFAGALDGFSCGSRRMRDSTCVEAYVRRFAPRFRDVQVKLAHCYEEWRAPDGSRVQCGRGLSERHVAEARDFFVAPAATRVYCHAELALWKAVLAWVTSKRQSKAVGGAGKDHASTSAAMVLSGIVAVAPELCLRM
mmetsp:Transcript_40545/g.114688  ORF Transcript_40545/g.114688 Transcript_40545/m.114688 type:complete len:311 (+) Transcript_40545:109-1041(+)